MDADAIREQLNLFVLSTGSERKALSSLERMTGLPRSTIYDFRRNKRGRYYARTLDRLNDIFDEGEWDDFNPYRDITAYGMVVRPRVGDGTFDQRGKTIKYGLSGQYWTQVLKPPTGTVRFMILYYKGPGYGTASTGYLPTSQWGSTKEWQGIDPASVIAVYYDIPGGVRL